MRFCARQVNDGLEVLSLGRVANALCAAMQVTAAPAI